VNPANREGVVDAAAERARADRAPATHASIEGATADRASAIYGSLLVTALVAAQARSDAIPEFIAATLLVGVGVFWLTEVWTELIAIRTNGPITWPQVRSIARAELPMLSAAIFPTMLLLTATVGITTPDVAATLALAVAIVQLFAWGLVVGLAMNRGWLPALVVALVDVALGMVIVALKVFVLH
jgi:hypothetical protein